MSLYSKSWLQLQKPRRNSGGGWGAGFATIEVDKLFWRRFRES